MSFRVGNNNYRALIVCIFAGFILRNILEFYIIFLGLKSFQVMNGRNDGKGRKEERTNRRKLNVLLSERLIYLLTLK